MVLQCLIMSGGMPSFPGALPQVKLSIALPRSSSNGIASSSSMMGRGSMTSSAEVTTTFSLEWSSE